METCFKASHRHCITPPPVKMSLTNLVKFIKLEITVENYIFSFRVWFVLKQHCIKALNIPFHAEGNHPVHCLPVWLHFMLRKFALPCLLWKLVGRKPSPTARGIWSSGFDSVSLSHTIRNEKGSSVKQVFSSSVPSAMAAAAFPCSKHTI